MKSHLVLPVFLAVHLLTFVSHAEEGFFSERIPTSIQRAWDVTIGYSIQPGNNICSASLVDKEIIKGRKYLIFLSAGHCLAKVHGFKEDSAVSDQKLLRATINKTYADFRIDVAKREWLPAKNETPFILPLVPVWTYQHSFYDPVKPGNDILLIAFETSGDITNIRPLEISNDLNEKSSGTRNYIVGFPGTFLRSESKQNVPIAESDVLRKRWSYGAIASQGEDKNLLNTTADCLSGDSGGPALGATGRIIGIMSVFESRDDLGNADYSYHKEGCGLYSPDNLEIIVNEHIKAFRSFIALSSY